MAADYNIVGSLPTTEFLGGTKTRSVVTVQVTTNPHGVYFEFRVPHADFTPHTVATYAEQYAANVEVAFQNPAVAGIEWIQTPTANGFLQDQAIVTVQSDSGNSTDTVTVPWGALDPRALDPKIQALREKLNAVENL